MNIELNDREREYLRYILEYYLSELRMEIADTERLSWRLPMHEEENFIKEMLKKLSAVPTV
jgi:hypothetical protein